MPATVPTPNCSTRPVVGGGQNSTYAVIDHYVGYGSVVAPATYPAGGIDIDFTSIVANSPVEWCQIDFTNHGPLSVPTLNIALNSPAQGHIAVHVVGQAIGGNLVNTELLVGTALTGVTFNYVVHFHV